MTALRLPGTTLCTRRFMVFEQWRPGVADVEDFANMCEE